MVIHIMIFNSNKHNHPNHKCIIVSMEPKITLVLFICIYGHLEIKNLNSHKNLDNF